MAKTIFLHQLPDVKDLFEVVAKEQNLLPSIVEKDYWLMHCLWGIQQQGINFEMKGGTSLSKGFGLIERFSEDIDLQIYPHSEDNIKIGKNHDKRNHIESRRNYFDAISKQLKVTNLIFRRDVTFDDKDKMRNAGIRAEYESLFMNVPDLKEGVVLELGFDQTAPNIACDISSWAFDKTLTLDLVLIDNRAKQVKCYCPEYTFVEKLQTISTKYRQQQENGTLPINFLRHYYDVYRLLENDRVLKFIGTKEYYSHKEKRFRVTDRLDITQNPAFNIKDEKTLTLYSEEFSKKSAMYFGAQPKFEEILKHIGLYINLL